MEERATVYEGIRNRVVLCEVVLSLAFLTLFSISGASSLLSGHIVAYCPNIWLSIGFYVVCFTLIYSVLVLPLSFYGGFVVERRFGLSTQTFSAWAWEGAKTFLLGLALSLAAVELVYLFLRRRPDDWWLWGAFAWIGGGILLARVAPRIVIPLFFKVRPLEDGELGTRLTRLAEKAGAAVREIYSIDLSRKTKKANAAVAGLGSSKKIILSDTLLRGYSTEEIESVLAHELGHYAGGHLLKRVALSSALTFCGFFLAGSLMAPLTHVCGIGSVSDIASLPLLILVLFVVGLAVLPLENAYSRRLEAAADAFSLDMTGDPDAFIRAMEKLAAGNLVVKRPHRVVEFLLHGHPSIASRIAMARDYMNSVSGGSCTDLSQSI